MPHPTSEPDPRGSLDPPRRTPPTAIGTETPGPEPEPRHRLEIEAAPALIRAMRPAFRAWRAATEAFERARARVG